jgi:hypothetical protein
MKENLLNHKSVVWNGYNFRYTVSGDVIKIVSETTVSRACMHIVMKTPENHLNGTLHSK